MSSFFSRLFFGLRGFLWINAPVAINDLASHIEPVVKNTSQKHLLFLGVYVLLLLRRYIIYGLPELP